MSLVDLNTDIKPWLGIDPGDTTYDTILSMIQNSVEQAVKNYTEAQFEPTVVTNEILDGDKADTVTPKNYPLISVQQLVFYVDADGSGGSVIDSSEYTVNPEGVVLQSATYSPYGRGRIRVDYTWGYASLPDDVKMAILLGVEATFRRRGRKSIGLGGRSKKDESERFTASGGGDQAAWDSKTGLPKEVVAMLSHYRAFEIPVQPMAVRNR